VSAAAAPMRAPRHLAYESALTRQQSAATANAISNFPEADLNEAARAADAFACIDTSVRNYPLEEPMTPEVR
jgi:hypothetical protein